MLRRGKGASMQTDYLREFVDLCDTLNFTKSARRMNVAQSTLSRHIMAFEGEIGARLFDRSGDMVRLTPSGRLLYDEARKLIRNIDDMQAIAKRNAQERVTTLKVSGSTIQPTLNRFMTRMQAQASARRLPIRFEYTHVRSISAEQPPREAIELLDSAEADLLIEFFVPDSEQLALHRHITLAYEPLVAVVSSENPLAQKEILTLDELSGQTLFLCSMYQHCTTLYEDALRRGGCVPEKVRTAIIDDLLVVPELLAHLAPNEVSIFQANFAAEYGFGDDGEGGVCQRSFRDPIASLIVYLMWRSDDTRPEIQSAVELADSVRKSFRDHPSPDAYRFFPACWETVEGENDVADPFSARTSSNS